MRTTIHPEMARGEATSAQAAKNIIQAEPCEERRMFQDIADVQVILLVLHPLVVQPAGKEAESRHLLTRRCPVPGGGNGAGLRMQ